TGWNPQEAVGQSLSLVFRTINDRTHNALDSPVRRALATGTTAAPSEPALLQARDGTERRVAGAAAPVHDVARNVCGAVLVFREQPPPPAAAPAAAHEPQPRADTPADIERRKDELLALLSRELHDSQAPIARGLDLLRHGHPADLAQARSLIEQQARHL